MNYKNILTTIMALAEGYPRCFSLYEGRRKPLKIGIREDLVAALGIAAKEIGIALRLYTSNAGYLMACREGAERIGLDGEACGHVTAEEAADAKRRLEEQYAKRKRRQAALAKEKEAAKRRASNKGRVGLADLRRAARARRAA